MKQIINILFVTLLGLSAVSAEAQYPAPIIGGGMVCQQPMPYINGRWYCPGGFVSGGGTVIIPQQQGIRINVGGGGMINSCSAIGGILGGTAGSFAKNHTLQAVIIGAVLGGTIGSIVCSENGRNINYADSRVNQRAIPSRCKIDGRDEIRGVSEDMCVEIAREAGRRATGGKTEAKPQELQQEIVNPPAVVAEAEANIHYRNPVTGETIHGRVSSQDEANRWIAENVRYCTYKLRSQPGSNRNASCGDPKKI